MVDNIHGSVTQIGPSVAPKLEATQGPNAGETYRVKLTTRIGRERDNDVILTDPKVSRHHARIDLQEGVWVLTDLGSANKTYLNGAVVTSPTPLESGDRIRLGETELTFHLPLKPDSDAPIPRRAARSKAETIVAAAPAPKPDTAAAPQVAQTTPSRMFWLVGGFVALLAVAAVVLFTVFLSREPATAPTPTAAAEFPETPVAGTPAAAADIPSTPGLVLAYEEDFSDSFGGWDDAFDTYTTKQYGNHRYQIEVTASNLVAWGMANRSVSDFEVQVETRLEDGSPTNSFGLLFRFKDRDNFYRFDISGDGFFLLSKFVDAHWVTLVDWTESPALNTGVGADNILKVSAFGPQITVWANGQKLASVTDDSLTEGNFGFFASTFSEPYIWVSFDNLKMWVPAGKEQAITMIPTATRPSAAPADTPAPAPTSTAVPSTATASPEAETAISESPLPTATATPTPQPLPEYASRDQTLGRGERPVSGRILFPLFDPQRGIYDIYIADAADGDNRELVQANASQPAASADGKNIAYRSWQADKRGLFTRPLAGGDAWGFDLFFESARPQISPADQSLMYYSRTGGKEPAIYRVINGVGEVMRRESVPVQGKAPKWSPDGQQFVYSGCLGNECGIILSNIDGSNPRLLTDHPTDTSPEISPDGKQVVFMSQRGGDWEIYSVSIDGGKITALTSDDASTGLPTWSPDGRKIAFVSNRDGEWAIWDMNPDGSAQRRLFTLDGTINGTVQHDPANSFGWVEENIDWIP